MKRQELTSDSDSNQISEEEFKFFIENIGLENIDLDQSIKLIDKYGYEQLNKLWQQTSDKFNSLLHLVAEKGHHNLFKFLIEEGGAQDTPSANSKTAIHYAAEYGNLQNLQYLLERDADINAADSIGRTPISLAAQNGHNEAVKLMLEKGADISGSSIKCILPLLCASVKGHTETVKLLLEKGANPNIGADNTYVPLMLAARNGHTETVKLLIEGGANIEVADAKGPTPILYAARNGHIETVKLMLEKGAKINLSSIHDIYLNDDFDIEEHAIFMGQDGNTHQNEYYKIKNFLLGVVWLQKVTSQDVSTSINFKPFFWDSKIKDLFKVIINNKINSAANYGEIRMICKKVMEIKDLAMISLQSLSAKFNEDSETVENRVRAFEEIFNEITEEIIVPLSGEGSHHMDIPRLSLLALSKSLSDSNDYLKFFKDYHSVREKAKIAIKGKLLSDDQEEKVKSALTQLEEQSNEVDITSTKSTYDHSYEIPRNDSVDILGDEI